MTAAAPLAGRFDSVVMLTWSNWKSEPRSNRYHYAMRFARKVPVLFVQPDQGPPEEETELHDVRLLHVGTRYDDAQLAPVARALAARGLERPLVWTYNPSYRAIARHFPGALRVFHATEDYFSGSTSLAEPLNSLRFAYREGALSIQRRMVAAIGKSDLVVCVSPGVAEGIAKHCGYRGPIAVLENGCDFAFWSTNAGGPRNAAQCVAIYQGGINERLDVALIVETMRRLPDWEFRFCGAVSDSFAGWQAVRMQPNYSYLGALPAEQLREELQVADVGLMPYRQVRSLTSRLLPLKAFEYAACGLPVVSVPIDSIAHLSQVFRFARSAVEFAAAIREEAALRDDPSRRAARLDAAREQDYDRRFAELEEMLRTAQPRRHFSTGAYRRVAAIRALELWNRALSRITSFARL